MAVMHTHLLKYHMQYIHCDLLPLGKSYITAKDPPQLLHYNNSYPTTAIGALCCWSCSCNTMCGRYGVLSSNRCTHPAHEDCQHSLPAVFKWLPRWGGSHPNWCRGWGGRFWNNSHTTQVWLTVRVSFLLFESACFRIGNSCRMVSYRMQCRHYNDITMTSWHYDIIMTSRDHYDSNDITRSP